MAIERIEELKAQVKALEAQVAALVASRDAFIEIITTFARLVSSLMTQIKYYRPGSNARTVISATEILRQQLGLAIKIQVDHLTKSDVRRLLGRKGSPDNLTARIHVAHKLGVLDDAMCDLAIRIKDLRNVFGHDMSRISLQSDEAAPAFNALHTDPAVTGTYVAVFVAYLTRVTSHISAYVSRQGSDPDA